MNLQAVLLALNFHKEQHPSLMSKSIKHLPTYKNMQQEFSPTNIPLYSHSTCTALEHKWKKEIHKLNRKISRREGKRGWDRRGKRNKSILHFSVVLIANLLVRLLANDHMETQT